MFPQSTRRRFLQTAGIGATALGLGDLSAFLHLNPAQAAETKSRSWQVRYGAAIEPLVRLIEETPQEKCVEVVVEELRRGLSYRDFMAALLLAGLRNGGDLGYYHCIYMIHAANQLTLDAPVGERLLAMFGVMDHFKYWQNRRAGESNHFGMQRFPEKIPGADKALPQFHAAMSSGDPDAAEAAVVSLARSEGRSRLFDLIGQYGYRGGGVHQWIFVSNTWRVLEAIGWERAEPVWRAMVRLLAGTSEWADNWYLPQRESRRKEIESLPPGWAEQKADAGLSRELLAVMGERNADGAFEICITQLVQGAARAGAVWDGAHLAAAEAYIRGDTTNALHSNTGLNALHYAFRASGNVEIRMLAMMRAMSWLCEPISAYPTRDKNPLRITELTPIDIPAGPELAAEEIVWSGLTKPDKGAVGKAIAFAQQHPDSNALWELERRLALIKGGDAHDYKFLAALWEDSQLVSPQWRPILVAASVGKPRYRVDVPDATVIAQAREALKGL